MYRLTKRNKQGTGYYYPKCFKKCKGYGASSKCDNCDLSIESCNKLGEYEETGLTPAQIYQINELYSEQVKELMEYRKSNRWIPCSERLPEEHDSIFAKLKGTDKWSDVMFEKISDDVNVTVEFENGTRKTMTLHTNDGKWNTDNRITKFNVIAWQPLPEPYHTNG